VLFFLVSILEIVLDLMSRNFSGGMAMDSNSLTGVRVLQAILLDIYFWYLPVDFWGNLLRFEKGKYVASGDDD
jgi:hypothetical protein